MVWFYWGFGATPFNVLMKKKMVPHPIGMHRSVEDDVSVQHVHPIGMHPHGMQYWWGIACFYRATHS
jgi:hypothetical protein